MPRTTRLGRIPALVAAVGIGLTACSSAPGPSVTGASSSAQATRGNAVPSPIATPVFAGNPELTGQIAFVAEAAPPGHAQIWIENADGTNLRQLVMSSFDDRSPAISPDGTRVLFTRYVPDGAPLDDAGVFMINTDGTGLRQLDTNGEDPSWSPDGLQFVETRGLFDKGATSPYSVALWTENVDGTGLKQITRKGLRCDNACPEGYQDNRARWSPDGKMLVFMRDLYTTPEQHEIFWMYPRSSILHEMRVTPNGLDADDPQWSRDGALILFQSPPDPSTADQNLYTISRDGTGLTQLTSHPPKDANGVSGVFHPAWSPDGTMIVFSRYPGGTAGASLYVMQADGSNVRVASAPQFDANGADWGVLPSQ